MKKVTLLCFIIFLLFNTSFVQAQSLVGYRVVFEGPLKAWAQSFHEFKLSDFKKQQSVNFENKNTRLAQNTAAFYPVYSKVLSLSPNGNHLVDIYSYLLIEKKNGRLVSTGADVEQSILLGDLQNLRWRQIAYYGYSQRVQEVCWLDNNSFIMAATRLNRDGKQIPVVVIGDLKSQHLEIFHSSNIKCYQKTDGFVSPKLLALHIQKAIP